MNRLWAAAAIAALSAFLLPVAAAEGSVGPNGPVGWSIYRQLNQLPYVPTGVETLDTSSYDRSGGNDDGFNGTYSCLHVDPDGCVIAEHSGPGELDSIWFTRDGGDVSATGNIKIQLDGRTVLNAPLQQVVNGAEGPPYVFPAVANADRSSGGVYIKVPMPFTSSMRITTDQNPRFYHVYYRTFSRTTGVKTFSPFDPASSALTKLQGAGYTDPKPPAAHSKTTRASFSLAPGQGTTLAKLKGPGSISALQLQIPQLVGPPNGSDSQVTASAQVLDGAHLVISFDGRRTVDSPLGEFFGDGLGYYPVHSLMFGVDARPFGWLSSWWPMPYARRATVRLVNRSSQTITSGKSRVASAVSKKVKHKLSPSGHFGYFSATSHAGPTTPGADWPFLVTFGQGKVVGVSQTMLGPNRTYLEGDEIGYIDHSPFPQIHGTGTEDFYEGGWYWNRGPYSDPLTGEPAHEEGQYGCFAVCDNAYRLFIADSIPFANAIDFGIEHGDENSVQAAYSSTAFWYQRP